MEPFKESCFAFQPHCAPPASAGKPHSPRLALPSTARSMVMVCRVDLVLTGACLNSATVRAVGLRLISFIHAYGRSFGVRIKRAALQSTELTGPLHVAFQKALTLHRALRRMAGLVFLLVFWVLAGACQRHGVGVFLLCNSSSLFRKLLLCLACLGYAFRVGPRSTSPN